MCAEPQWDESSYIHLLQEGRAATTCYRQAIIITGILLLLQYEEKKFIKKYLYGTNQQGWGEYKIKVIILRILNLGVLRMFFSFRGLLVVPGHNCLRQSKNVVHISWRHQDDQVEAFHAGVIPETLNFEFHPRYH